MPGDGIYIAILYVMVGSIVFGAVLALLGGTVYQSEAMQTVGTGIVLICGAIYLVFRWLGRKEMQKRARRNGGTGGENGDGGA